MRMVLLAGALGAMLASVSQAQASAATATTKVTTADSVYTRDQSARGQDSYAGYCRSCHTAQSHTGPTFEGTWNGKMVSDLFAFLREKMPKNEPGSLSDQEYVDIVAYLLQLNNMPAGARELPADSLPLKSIRIQLKP